MAKVQLKEETKEQMRKLRIFFDVDDVLVSFTKGICNICEKKFNKPFNYEDVVWGFKNCEKEEIEFIESLFCNVDFIDSLPLMNGAIKAVNEMIDRGHEVMFCTATYSTVMTTRALYLINHFKDIHPRNIIITGRKDVIDGDILFDDSVNNIVNSRVKVPVVVTSPWNKDLTGYVRAEDPEDYIKIVDLVEQGYSKHDILALQEPKYLGSTPCIISVVGPSGSGKTTIAEYLLNNYSDRFEKVITDTTRNPREGEINGVHYNFRTPEEFQKNVENGRYAEFSPYAKNRYGSPKKEIDRILKSGKCPIMVLDVNGANSMSKEYPNQSFSVFLNRSKEELIASILERNIPQTDKINRIIQLEKDFQASASCTYAIDNDGTIENAAKKILAILP